MTEQDLRALIREAVVRALSSRGLAGACAPHGAALAPVSPAAERSAHPSHAIYLTVVNEGQACVIEPGVACNHCDYCKSHGH